MSVDLTRLRNLADLNSLAQGAQEDRVLLLDPDDIVVEKQVRTTFKGIEELAESMRDHQQAPIIVSPLNKDTGKYLLQKGERRLRAARLIGGGYKIKAIVDSTKRTDAEQAASQMIENIQREDLTPIEIGRGLLGLRSQLVAEGKKGTGKELAQLVRKPESWVSRHLALADVPDELAQLIEDEITVDSEVIYSLKQIGEIDPERFATLISRARDPEQQLSREEVRRELKAAKGLPESKAAPAVPPQPSAEAEAGAGIKKGQGAVDEAAQPDAPGTVSVPQSFDEAALPPSTNPGGTEPVESPKVAIEPSKDAGKERVPAKLGKSEIATIPPASMVVAVRVALDRNYVTGELLLNKVCGDPSKGLVSILIGGKPTERLVPLDQIELLSMMPLATD